MVRADVLSRQQAAILWLIRSQGDDGSRMRRKDIESNVQRWFEVTSAALSKSLRAMMRPPLEVIEITEDPRSGREKLVALTPKGKAFLDTAATKAGMVLAELIEDVPLEVVDHAITYFRYLTGAFPTLKRAAELGSFSLAAGQTANPKKLPKRNLAREKKINEVHVRKVNPGLRREAEMSTTNVDRGAEFDLVIRGGRIVDGTRMPAILTATLRSRPGSLLRSAASVVRVARNSTHAD